MRIKVLSLCHANRFRSPLLAVFLAKHPYLDVRSAGFLESNRPAGKPVRDVALKLGYDLSLHRSTQINKKLVAWSDRILVMNPTQQTKLCTSYPEHGGKVLCLGHFLKPNIESIPDLGFINPRDARFEEVVSMIQQASLEFAAWVKTKYDID